MEASNKISVELLKEFLEAFNEHNLDKIMSFFADKCVLEMPKGPFPWGDRYINKTDVRKGLATRFKGVPDVHFGNDRHWVSGNFGFSEWTLTGTLLSGDKIEVNGTDHLEFLDGKVIRKNSFWKIID